ncbi:hypothetical protein NE237_003713 [Protea cynaroides]|uniref:Uncharacterized protein n=1 Tax=Protea cynaroides TaxID=273540 RepID=A0A9Q0KI09_9MAGN|nr:hypothetical protein NE237_003713 [Protea cynaroides]
MVGRSAKAISVGRKNVISAPPSSSLNSLATPKAVNIEVASHKIETRGDKEGIDSENGDIVRECFYKGEDGGGDRRGGVGEADGDNGIRYNASNINRATVFGGAPNGLEEGGDEFAVSRDVEVEQGEVLKEDMEAEDVFEDGFISFTGGLDELLVEVSTYSDFLLVEYQHWFHHNRETLRWFQSRNIILMASERAVFSGNKWWLSDLARGLAIGKAVASNAMVSAMVSSVVE